LYLLGRTEPEDQARTVTSQDESRRDRRPLAARLGLWVGPLIVPVLLFAVVFVYAVSRDAEPAGFGEPGTGLVPGAATVTGWQQDMSLVPAGYGPNDPGHPTPRALVDAMVAGAREAADGESWISGRIESEDIDAATARVYMPLPEYPDAFVAAELVLELSLDPDGWHVADAHVRFHCERTVRGALCG
jgi:hypothetical protein